MTTTDKLARIANNVPLVYKSGFDSGYDCFRDNLDDLKRNTTVTTMKKVVDIRQYGGETYNDDGFYSFGVDAENTGNGEGTIYTAYELTTPKTCTITAYGNGGNSYIVINNNTIDIHNYTNEPYVYSGSITTPINFYYSFSGTPAYLKIEETLTGVMSASDLYGVLWDAFQQSGARTDYKGMISSGSNNIPNPGSFGEWTSKYILPKYSLKPTGVYGMFAFCSELLEAPSIDFSNAGTDISSLFFKCIKMKYVPAINITKSTAFKYVFLQCRSLVTITSINAPLVKNWVQAFMDCPELQNITFVSDIIANIDFHWSTKLTDESLNNIVSHLSPLVTGKTITLSKTAVGRISDNLLLSKSNWTIAYL